MERIIGKYRGQRKGALVFAIGGIHGNELAGVKAIETLLQMLQKESIKKIDFQFQGTFVGLRGNLKALSLNMRFVEKDLNRQWTTENIDRIVATTAKHLTDEDAEVFNLLKTIQTIIQEENPTEILFVDLHTTSAEGGIFIVVTDSPRSLGIAKEIEAPVIQGLLNGINGTTLHYFNTQNLGKPTAAICFEAGSHFDLLSVTRSVAALVNALKAMGCIAEKDIETHHSAILKQYSKDLPALSTLLYCHKITSGDNFEMKLGYQNFQNIKKGEVLATDKNGDIQAPYDCQILMPLYQKQGNDGFFLIKSTDC
jgi:succinylglutamate desuccinylase